MATVHLGRMFGQVGFARTVAIKRLHPTFSKDPAFTAMFLDEARLATRIHHPNVVTTLDVVMEHGELFLVMEHVLGDSLAGLMRAAAAHGGRLPTRIAAAIVIGALHGLHAAHEARSEEGAPLGIVHRDVSPQNILISADGVPRVLDFGVAKAAGRLHTTREGEVKGKLAYMAPEQILLGEIDRRVDVFAAGIVLWEALTGQKLFGSHNPGHTLNGVLHREVPAPSTIVPDLPSAIDAVVLRALQRNVDLRFQTARDMAVALEEAASFASAREVGEYVARIAEKVLRKRAAAVSEVEASKPVELSFPVETESRSITSPALESLASGVRLGAGQPVDVPTVADALSASRAVPPRPNRRGPALIAGAAVVALLSVIVIVVKVSSRAPAVPPSPLGANAEAPSAAASIAASSSASASTTAASSAEAPPVVTPVQPAPSAPAASSSSQAPLPSASTSSAPHGSAPPIGAPRAAKGGAAKKPDCSQRFRVDANGVRIPRPECF
ncbi:Serine/Threonine protein kinase [Minicystis rosea]|nr:Serine/Threonine protein kinase [Minicystis rosea]